MPARPCPTLGTWKAIACSPSVRVSPKRAVGQPCRRRRHLRRCPCITRDRRRYPSRGDMLRSSSRRAQSPHRPVGGHAGATTRTSPRRIFRTSPAGGRRRTLRRWRRFVGGCQRAAHVWGWRSRPAPLTPAFPRARSLPSAASSHHQNQFWAQVHQKPYSSSSDL